ncbi:MAG: response regulator [Casimicrobiaceae bacterium]
MSATTATEATVYVVEDDEAVRDSLLLLLRLKGFLAQGYDSAERFLGNVHSNWAGCMLLDLRMPAMSGLELQAELARRGIKLPIIIITAHGDVAAARAAFRSGASDFLEKPLNEAALLSAIATALALDQHRRELDEAAIAFSARISRLTPREREVMWLVGDGCQNVEIAATLGLSPRTVEVHKARMMERLGVGSLADLLRLLRSAKNGKTTED